MKAVCCCVVFSRVFASCFSALNVSFWKYFIFGLLEEYVFFDLLGLLRVICCCKNRLDKFTLTAFGELPVRDSVAICNVSYGVAFC
jgi:hypothetical protein